MISNNICVQTNCKPWCFQNPPTRRERWPVNAFWSSRFLLLKYLLIEMFLAWRKQWFSPRRWEGGGAWTRGSRGVPGVPGLVSHGIPGLLHTFWNQIVHKIHAFAINLVKINDFVINLARINDFVINLAKIHDSRIDKVKNALYIWSYLLCTYNIL